MIFLRDQFQCTGRNVDFNPLRRWRGVAWGGIIAITCCSRPWSRSCFYKPGIPKRVWVIGVACSVIPDFDVIGFRFGIRYGDFWGHRGFTHSLVFATILASAIVLLIFRDGLPNISPLSMWVYFFLATVSHGLLDSMTDGGLGVAFFAPFDNHRYFLSWTPIRVSPIGIGRFFTGRGYAVLQSELLWIWIPSGVLIGSALFLRRRNSPISK